jgi:cell pole-organizing protein PopZ
MTQPAKAQEPSMEEILASIRRIIADDDAAKPAAKAPAKPAEAPPAKPAAPAPAAPAEAAGGDDMDAMLADLDENPQPAPEPPDEVLELTEAMAAPAPEPAQPSFRRIDPDQPDVVFDDVAPAPPPPAAPRVPAADSPLLSNAASAAVHSAFGSLAHSVLAQNPRTLEDLVKEMLRPMLKAWLDDNLPVMVERMVRAEIERVSRGPRN